MFRVPTLGLVVGLSLLTSMAWSAQRENVSNIDISALRSPAMAGVVRTEQREKLRQVLGLGQAHRLEVRQQKTDPQGNRHTRYRQFYQGLPVWGQELILHEGKRGEIRATGHITRGLENAPSALSMALATLSADAAMTILQENRGHQGAHWQLSNLHTEQVIYIDAQGEPRQAYFVHYFAETVTPGIGAPARPYALIDAQTGHIFKQWDGIAQASIGTGPGGNEKSGAHEYGTDRPFLEVEQIGSTCFLESARVRTIDMQNSDLNNETHGFTCPRNSGRAVNGAFSPLNDAHFYGHVTFEMFLNWLGVPPLNFQLVMRVHYGINYNNAFWNGSSASFGDGDPTDMYPLVDINVTAHEVAHGFTEQYSGLLIFEEAGGINEAFSDIAGEAAEYFLFGSVDWYVGAEIMKNSDGFRDFIDPPSDGYSIAHASDYVEGMDEHDSSGVFNHAFYLLATTPGWDIPQAFEVFAYANMYFWEPFEDFSSATCGVIEATHLLGYPLEDVLSAFDRVGAICPMDSDADGMDDYWERQAGLNPYDPTDAAGDLDGDGLDNLGEYQYQTNPRLSDTDGDGLSDGREVLTLGTNPLKRDTDDDGVADALDAFPLHRAASVDSDQDGFPDAWHASCNLSCQQSSGLQLDRSLNDTDNDGLANHLDADNSRDNMPPVFAAPPRITVVATGDLTSVSFSTLQAHDFVDGVIEAQTSQSNQLAPGRHQILWLARDTAGNEGSVYQVVDVLPLASFVLAEQTAHEGTTVTVTVQLNGVAPEYPVVIPYQIDAASTASLSDHTLRSGFIRIDQPGATSGSIRFQILQDQVSAEGVESLLIQLVNQYQDVGLNRAGLSSQRSHQVWIHEQNRAPGVAVDIFQSGERTRHVNRHGEAIQIKAQVIDADLQDSHTLTWQLNGAQIASSTTEKQLSLSPDQLRDGENTLVVIATDNGAPAMSGQRSYQFTAYTPDGSGSGGGGAWGLGQLLLYCLVLCGLRLRCRKAV